jgi:hypothetical protein
MTTMCDTVARLVREALGELCADGNVREEGSPLYPFYTNRVEGGQDIGIARVKDDIPEEAYDFPAIMLDVVLELPGWARDLFEASDLFTDDLVMVYNRHILEKTGAIVVPSRDGDDYEVTYVGGRCPECGARTMRMVCKSPEWEWGDGVQGRFDLCLNEKCAKRIAGDGYTMPCRP